MRQACRQHGFTLLEMLVTAAVILILISILIGAGRRIKERAAEDLNRSMLEVLCTAVEQYYDEAGRFPFVANAGFNENDLEGLLAAVVDPPDSLVEKDGLGNEISNASSAALYYFLSRIPSSRSIAAAVTDTLITSKDASGQAIRMEQPAGSGIWTDLPRYIDSWKTSIRYEYQLGWAFPVLTSAGPDKVFGTPDDITSK
ncbi:MAG TPA: type II secretion system protein [Anaerohalosphaeraceae bacterium]|nr:type II secretion system protein [Phycisphaerae bacterium]HOK96618.1 type II secretion system protein [Anaerohalosphaeraceae bacterium]HOL31156.1 type II secretion system protein [Anaerohalosphaeraceae bacterium]HOM75857.1 type II secretion system protein [Anaerohalosphaeraceae bacterium]HPC63483.1 type II secretion system protein [Anaerohalosphaeraceae bacterium]